MSDPAWKKAERRIARYLGSERTPLSGGNGRATRSDSLHPRLFVETKHGKNVPRTWAAIQKLLSDTTTKAAAEDKNPVVVIHAKGRGNPATYPAYIWRNLGEGFIEMICVPLSVIKEMDRRGFFSSTTDGEKEP